MLDGGRNDEKIIAIPFADPTYNKYKDISELPEHIFDEMIHFFAVYKALEHKETVAGEANGREDAVRVVKEALNNYIENFCKYVPNVPFLRKSRVEMQSTSFLRHLCPT